MTFGQKILISLFLFLPLFLLGVDFVSLKAQLSEDSPWPMFQHDPQHTGQSPYSVDILDGTNWRYKIGYYLWSSPAIAPDGTIYIGSYEGYLYAINPDSTLKWRYETADAISSSPAIALDGTIYVGSGDGNLYAINPDGSLKWEYPTDDAISSSPNIDLEGNIYVGSSDGYVYALYPDGTLKWRYETAGPIPSSPAIGFDSTIYVGAYTSDLPSRTSNDYFYAINPDGTLKWTYPTEDYIYSSPAVASDGTIYVASEDGNLYAINPDGSLKWRYFTSGIGDSSPAVALDGTIYVGSGDGYLYAINPDGSLKWRYDVQDFIDSSAAIDSDGTVYLPSYDGLLYALNSDGSLKWKYRIEGGMPSPAISSDGTLYVGSIDGYLYAISYVEPQISEVSVSSQFFYPINLETATIRYTLDRDAEVTIKIYEAIPLHESNPPNRIYAVEKGNLVRTLADNQPRTEGGNFEIWDGRDDSGQILPEATYIYTISAQDESGGYTEYNPEYVIGEVTIEDISITESFNPYANECAEVTYTISESAWVTIKIGASWVDAAGEERTLLYGEPRDKGTYTELWDGRANDGHILEPDEYDSLVGDAIILPENALVIQTNSFAITNFQAEAYLIYPNYDQISTLSYTLTQDAQVTIKIHDPNGNYFRTIIEDKSQTAGSYTYEWDGENDEGKLISTEGNYSVQIKAEEASSGITVVWTGDVVVYR